MRSLMFSFKKTLQEIKNPFHNASSQNNPKFEPSSTQMKSKRESSAGISALPPTPKSTGGGFEFDNSPLMSLSQPQTSAPPPLKRSYPGTEITEKRNLNAPDNSHLMFHRDDDFNETFKFLTEKVELEANQQHSYNNNGYNLGPNPENPAHLNYYQEARGQEQASGHPDDNLFYDLDVRYSTELESCHQEIKGSYII